MKQLFPLLLLALTLTACNAKKVNDEEVNSEEFEQFDDECCCCPHFHIKFQPFGDFSEKEARALADIMKKEMEKMNDSVPATIDILPVKPLPKAAYYAARHRYHASNLLRSFMPPKESHASVVGLTHKDISVVSNSRGDWGVMGLSIPNSGCAVVSTFRIKNRSNLWKVVLHEYLHSIGFPHCPDDNPHCIMQDAHGRDTFSRKHAVCATCRKRFDRL